MILEFMDILKREEEQSNIIPDFASAEIYTRGLNREYLNDISEWIKNVPYKQLWQLEQM